MQLTKLRISGFKSFVEPTELLLEPGLTGIVGPNGCGKSNVVDALKWVMGETSAKQLRGGEMDDVIFAGTQNRPARNFAEVVLHMDNQWRKAPAQFNDSEALEITRRIDRGEGSTYKVNSRDVRQRDVQTLLADAATGAHSTAIVSQGRIGHLVNAKPTERRALLEEAAGIVGLGTRRHEAELRLNAAENNIKRSEDILRQLGEQLTSLKKQAKQASAYKSLAERYRQTESLFFYHQWQDIITRLQSAGARRAELDESIGQLESALTEVNTIQAELAAGIPELRQNEAERAAALQRLKLADHELSGEESRLAAQQMALENRLEQIQTDLARESQLSSDIAGNITSITAEQTEILSAQEQSSSELAQLSERSTIQAQLLRDAEELLQTLSDSIYRDESRWTALVERKNQMSARLARIDEELAKTQLARQNLTQQLESDDSLQLCLADVVFREAEVQNAKTKLADAESARSAAQQNLQSANEAAQQFNAAKSKLSAEADGLRSLLASQTDTIDPIMDHIRVDTGFEAALSAAMGDDLFASTQDSAQRFWRALPPLSEMPQLPVGARALSTVVSAPEALSRALAMVGVVDDAAMGRELQSQLAIGQCLVSKDGDLWRFDGYTATSGATQNTAIHLRHKNRLEQITGELTAHLTGEAMIGQNLIAAQGAASESANAEQAARAALESAYAAQQAARNKQSEQSQRLAVTQAELAAANSQIERLNGERQEVAEQLEKLSAEMGEKPDFDGMRANLSQQKLQVEELRNQAFLARTAHEQASRETKIREDRFNQLQKQLTDWQRRASETSERQAMLASRQNDATAEQLALANKPAELAASREKLLSALAEAEQARNQSADILAAAEQKLAETDRAARNLQSEISSHREERVKHHTAIELGETEQQKLQYDISERLETTPDQLLPLSGQSDPADIPDFQSTQNKLERLRRERDNMGPVNLRADIEAEEVEQKLTKQQTDHDELIEATQKLRGAISELNKEGRQRLVDAFGKVNENFSRLFTKLFGGGKAHLAWTEHEDPLEAGLEIFASPPGKKTQILSLLSGGERALTALALLFAVFECNPAPICVLDEVDAPLDENNVHRFCDMLDEMVQHTPTRYLVITHHRMTMSRMHRLFGVTMGEPGVSQLVSVDLQTAEKIRATA